MYSNLKAKEKEIDAYIICKHADHYEKTLELIEKIVDKKYSNGCSAILTPEQCRYGTNLPFVFDIDKQKIHQICLDNNFYKTGD